LLLSHLDPWRDALWYDLARELPMVGTEALSDHDVSTAAIALGQRYGVAIRSLAMVQRALVCLCHEHQRDPLKEWVQALPPWDGETRLGRWLGDYAGAEDTPSSKAISRLLPVSMIARALEPGCQYRNVVIFEGDENIGKSKLVKALASPEWYREVSHGLESKEAHMIIQGAWVAELAELSSLSKTEEARLKSFITMESDDYVPKFSNLPVSRKRRTIFVGTVNPEGEGTYLRGQTGNTRYLPIAVSNIDVDAITHIREQLFAEALVYWRNHPDDWWQVSGTEADDVRAQLETRRQASVYEGALAEWLEGKVSVTWEEIAKGFLLLEAKEKWKDRGLQMEIARGMRALGWYNTPEKAGTRSFRRWRPVATRARESIAALVAQRREPNA
jgi:predicted P-loop ATPase